MADSLLSLKTNAARLGQRLGENLAEHSRDLGLVDSFASGSGGGSGKYLESGAVLTAAGIEETKRMLGSRREPERMEGLKRVIAMMTKSLPVTNFFPLVTSLLSPGTPLSARTLISQYIVHCAATAPELALLSINAYQKDLSDPNPLVRAGAIRTLAAMGLDDIRSLVGVSVAKGARDTSWYVRRAAADAVQALWRADPTFENKKQLLPTLEVLIANSSPLTVGAALSAWEAVCPTRWELIHPMWRRWCKMLMDVEEWGQCELLKLMARYGRTFFLDPSRGKVDPDAELALDASEALLQHLNPAVVSAAVKLHWALSPPDRLSKVVRPLLRLLLSSSPEVQSVILEDCALIAEQRPDLLVDHLSAFFVRFCEPLASKRTRLRILVALTTDKNANVLLSELLVYVKDSDERFSAAAIEAMGTTAHRVPATASECLKTLIQLSQSKKDLVINQSVLVLRSLLQRKTLAASAGRPQVITKLVHLLQAGKINTPSARATVYWLVGQFAHEGLVESVGPDLVRLGAKAFAGESEPAKLQLVTLSAKLLVLSQLDSRTPNLRPLSLLFTYLTALARYDLNYSVRDRARFLKGLLASGGVGVLKAQEGAKLELNEDDFRRGVEVEQLGGGPTLEEEEPATLSAEAVRKVLFDGKLEQMVDVHPTSGELGTLSLSLPTRRLGFPPTLPAYSTTVPPSTIRDPPPEQLAIASRANTPVMKGFGSDSFAARLGAASTSNSGRNSPVVLVPTNFASGGVTGEASDQWRAGGSVDRAQKGGFVDLEDFYGDAEEEEESSEEEEGDEEEEDDDEEEEESEEGDEGDESVEDSAEQVA